ncbi:MAG TPA: hypothetical protein VHL85_03355 [Burkholderiales bacterium]|jgi:hypothetical protein|nr:hypothetical protein [Burkholderiales bacterium]
MNDKRIPIAIGVIVLLVVAGIAAYVIHKKNQTRAQQEEISALVSSATAELKEVLAKGASEEQLKLAQANLDTLRTMNVSRQPVLADAAEHYLISTNTIVRAKGDAARLGRQAAASRQALAAHIATRRNDAWFGAALKLKERVEKDHFDLNLAYKSLEDVLSSIGEDTRRLAPMVGADALLDEPTRAAARKQAEEDSQRAAAELVQARRLVEPR